jgi:hypothetical protein
MSLDTSNAVVSWRFDRGRQRELDRTEAATGSITVQNRHGLFDRTNLASPYHADIEPLVPAAISVRNPFTDTFHTLFSGYVEDWTYERPLKTVDQELLTVPLVDGFELLANAKVLPAGTGGEGGLFYAPQHVDNRIKAAAADAGLPAARTDINPGNVNVQGVHYPPGASMLEVMQDAADAEFPGVSNLFMGKTGVLAFRGRMDRFNRAAAGVPSFVLGDAWGMSEDASRVPIWFYRWALEKQNLFNSVLVTPTGADPADVPGQRVEAALSIAKYGRRDHDIQDLIVLGGDDGSTALQECHKFAAYYVNNYKSPYVRVYDLEVHSAMGEAAWDFIVNVGIGSLIELWTQHPGGGGLAGRQYFVEGIHAESERPGRIKMKLDLSPKDRWLEPPA